MSEDSYLQVLKGLESRGFGIKPGLERMQALVELLDNPQLTYPTIHIAGTNGKSSTARMVGAILSAQGLKTGVYTSPHLQSVTERFLLLGPGDGRYWFISEEDFTALGNYLSPFVQMIENARDEGVTYFELTTLMAYEWMAEKTVAAGVFEAGLGGRWDATNLVDPKVAILTRVGVDHSEFLGSTPTENAREKVGIVKSGSAVVSEEQNAQVAEVIESRVKEQGASLVMAGRDFGVESDERAVGGRLVSIRGLLGRYEEINLPVYGAHQSRNLALSVAGAESFLGSALDPKALQAAIARLKLAGRLEVVNRRPLIILDGAHNPQGAEALGAALHETFGAGAGVPSSPGSVTMIVSIFADKDIPGILTSLLPLADRVIFTSSGSDRSADPARLVKIAGELGKSGESIESLSVALEAALASAENDDLILVTGSLFAVGEARDYLKNK